MRKLNYFFYIYYKNKNKRERKLIKIISSVNIYILRVLYDVRRDIVYILTPTTIELMPIITPLIM